MGRGAYVPRLVREEMGKVLDAARRRLSPDQVGARTWLSAMKLMMTRGQRLLRPRYFLNNWWNDAEQIFYRHGMYVAVKQTIRNTVQNLAVAPGVGQAAAVGGVLEAFRKGAQAGSDRAVHLLDRLLHQSAMQLEVNRVLDGDDTPVRLGGRVYTYRQLRDVAVRGGVADSFDVAELRKQFVDLQAQQYAGSRAETFLSRG